MRYKKLSLLLITVLVISIVSLFISCPQPETTDTSGGKGATKDEKPMGSKNPTKQWHVSNFAGGGTSDTGGFINETGTAARFKHPSGIAVAPDGKALYVADTDNDTIRKISLPEGVVTTIASTDEFKYPEGIAVAPDGKALYVADTFNDRIKKITLPGNEVETIAGDGTIDEFNFPSGIAVAKDGTLYVVDKRNSRIRKITIADGKATVSDFAGSTTTGFTNATGTAARFKHPIGIAVAPDGNALYVADSGNHAIRKITLPEGVVSTFAGSSSGTLGLVNGTGTDAQFRNPQRIAVAPDGETLYVADTLNHRIRKITKVGEVSTIAEVTQPSGITVASSTVLYVTTISENRIKKIEYK